MIDLRLPDERRDRLVTELLEHPELQDPQWIARIADEQLELLIARLDQTDELNRLLTDLQDQGGSRG